MKDGFIFSVDYSCTGNFLISISVFIVIHCSRNTTSARKDLMLIMVFLAQLEIDFLN